MLKIKRGRQRKRDRYTPLRFYCDVCGHLIQSCAVGNGAGERYAIHFAEKALKKHTCRAQNEDT